MLTGEKIRKLRLGKGLTQEALAFRLMVDVTTVQRWESGNTRPSLPTQQRLLEFFHKSPVWHHALLSELLSLKTPVAFLDEFAIYRGANHAFSDILGIGDRESVIGSFCADICSIWETVIPERTGLIPENLLFGDFDTISISTQISNIGKRIDVDHTVFALRQVDFAGVLVHVIESDLGDGNIACRSNNAPLSERP